MKDSKSMPVVKCASCGSIDLSPVYVCRNCGKLEFVESTMPGTGRIYSHTLIRMAPEAFKNEVPYRIALVDLEHNLRITARMEGDQNRDIEIGQQVFFSRVDKKGYWFRL